MEQPEFNLLFRRFAGLGTDDRVRDASSKASNTPERKQRAPTASNNILGSYDQP